MEPHLQNSEENYFQPRIVISSIINPELLSRVSGIYLKMISNKRDTGSRKVTTQQKGEDDSQEIGTK